MKDITKLHFSKSKQLNKSASKFTPKSEQIEERSTISANYLIYNFAVVKAVKSLTAIASTNFEK
jgi:hypothetical protein